MWLDKDGSMIFGVTGVSLRIHSNWFLIHFKSRSVRFEMSPWWSCDPTKSLDRTLGKEEIKLPRRRAIASNVWRGKLVPSETQRHRWHHQSLQIDFDLFSPHWPLSPVDAWGSGSLCEQHKKKVKLNSISPLFSKGSYFKTVYSSHGSYVWKSQRTREEISTFARRWCLVYLRPFMVNKS